MTIPGLSEKMIASLGMCGQRMSPPDTYGEIMAPHNACDMRISPLDICDESITHHKDMMASLTVPEGRL